MERSATFNKIIDYTLKKEDDGYLKRIQIEDDPDDAGGLTVLGLDKASHGNDVNILADLVRSGKNAEAIEKAKDIYYVDYYAKHKDSKGFNLFDRILDIQTISKTFDLCVNTGNGQAAKFVRRALNKLGCQLPVTSNFDDAVISAINAKSTDDFFKCVKAQTDVFILIVEKFIECLDDISKMNIIELINDVNTLTSTFKSIIIPKEFLDDDVLNATINEAKDFYIAISKKRNNKKYLNGWLRRVNSLYKVGA